MDVPLDVLKIIASYITKHKMKLLDWIPYLKLDLEYLSANPNAMHILKEYSEFIDKTALTIHNTNPEAISWIEANPDKFEWEWLSENPNAIHILEANQNKIKWSELSGNPNAIHILEANKNKIDWYELSRNTNAIHLLEANQDKIYWEYLSSNPNAIHLLEDNLDKIDWDNLLENQNAIHILEANQDKIHLEYLRGKNIPDGFYKSDYGMLYLLSKNPDIFEPDMKLINENIFNKAIILDGIIN
jgi:hypothetical protein